MAEVEDKRIRRTKKLLRQALTRLMQQKDFQSITVTDVVREADINRGTFYAHYRDVYDLRDKIETGMIEDFRGMIAAIRPSETVTLKLVNDELFNFEVAGWYDTSGQLLSGEATYALTLARDCITDIEVRLKPRTVTITRQGIARIEFQYLVMEGGRPVPKVAYDYRTQYSADYKASEPVKFYYEEYRLDTSKIPPVGRKSAGMPTIPKGATKSTFLWRCDEKFSVSIRPADNPGFKFNYNDRSVESQTTKYYLPSDITMTR